jgi:mRNA-degrading endonuclease RelE of RelBE toxin-antitoxin system
MYQVEFTEAAYNDFQRLSQQEKQDVFSFLTTLESDPKPSGIVAIPEPGAADGFVYIYDTRQYMIVYHVFEVAKVVRVMWIDKK